MDVAWQLCCVSVAFHLSSALVTYPNPSDDYTLAAWLLIDQQRGERAASPFSNIKRRDRAEPETDEQTERLHQKLVIP